MGTRLAIAGCVVTDAHQRDGPIGTGLYFLSVVLVGSMVFRVWVSAEPER